jgi:hypothetical protein
VQVGVVGFLDGRNDHLFKVEPMYDQIFYLHVQGSQQFGYILKITVSKGRL